MQKLVSIENFGKFFLLKKRSIFVNEQIFTPEKELGVLRKRIFKNKKPN
jgi:hypothetical protein